MHNNIVFKDVHGRSYNVSLLAKQHALLENDGCFKKAELLLCLHAG